MPLPAVAAVPSAISALDAACTAIVALILGKAASDTLTKGKSAPASTGTMDDSVPEAKQKALEDFAKIGAFANALQKAMEQAKDKDCSKRKKCPALSGKLKPVNHHMNPPARKYQAYITKFPEGVEWWFKGIDFDGFFPLPCVLVETKGNFDQFFFDKPPFNLKPFFKGADVALRDAKRQHAVVRQSPPTRLDWYFMTPRYCELMRNRFLAAGFTIQTHYVPMEISEVK